MNLDVPCSDNKWFLFGQKRSVVHPGLVWDGKEVVVQFRVILHSFPQTSLSATTDDVDMGLKFREAVLLYCYYLAAPNALLHRHPCIVPEYPNP